MKKSSLMKMLAGTMAAIMIVSVPVSAAEQVEAVAPGIESVENTSDAKVSTELPEEEVSGDKSSAETPSDEGNAGTPSDEGNAGTPADEGNAGTPADEGNAGTPADEGNAGTPVDEGNAGTPADEGNAGTPSDEGNAGTPSDEGNAGTPADEGNAGTPADESNAGTPADEGSTETTPDEEATGDLTVTLPETEEGEPASGEGNGTETTPGEGNGTETTPGEGGGSETTPGEGGDAKPEETQGIKWEISAEGCLTVTGSGNPYKADAEGNDQVEWLSRVEEIKSAKITLTECTKLDGLFVGCVNLTEVDFSETDAAKVTSAVDIFKGCTALEKVISPVNMPIDIEMPAVAPEEYKAWFLEDGKETTMIPAGEKSQTVYKRNIKDINGKVENIDWKIDDSGLLTISGTGDYINAAVPGSKAPWLSYASKIRQAKVTLSGCTNLSGMFYGCFNLLGVDLNELITANVTDMSYMFYGCEKLNTVFFPVATFTTSAVTSMEGMFAGCAEISNLDLRGFDLNLTTNTNQMFDGCVTLQFLQGPKNVKMQIALPLTEEHPVWYLNDITEVVGIPVGVESINLYRDFNTISIEDVKGGVNRLYAKKVGEDINKSKQVKGDIWVAGFEEDSLEFTGRAVTQNVRVYDRTRLLKSSEYTLSYKNNVEARQKTSGSAPKMTVKLSGKEYTGSRSIAFSINPVDINGAQIASDGSAVSYNGKKQKFNPKVTFNGKTMKKGTHYTVQYDGDDLVGDPDGITEVPFTIYGKGSFIKDSTISGTYYIVGAKYNLSNATVTYNKKLKYDGAPVTADDLNIKVKIKNKTIQSEYYTVEVQGFENSGTGTVLIRPSEEGSSAFYQGYCKKKITLTGAYSLKQSVELNDSTWLDEISYNATLCNSGGIKQGENLLTDGTDALTEGIDYKVTYSNNKKVGKAKAVFTGCGKYNGTLTKTFKITPAETIVLSDLEPVEYAKDGAVPKIVVTDEDGVVLKENKDYTVKLMDNKEIGQGTCTVKGKGNYARTAGDEKPFDITYAVLTNDCITAADKPYKNSRNAYKSVPVLYDKQNGKTLKAGKDYEKSFRYEKKVGDGTYVEVEKYEILPAGTTVKVTAEGMGNYTGSCSAWYKIYNSKYNIKKLFITVDDQFYDADGVELALSTGDAWGDIHVYLSKIDMIRGANEQNAVDYLEIESYTNNKKVGTATVTLRGTGKYGGQKKCKFKIIPKTVSTVGISSVTLKGPEGSVIGLAPGGTGQLLVDWRPTTADKPKKITYKSSDTSIVTVTKNGDFCYVTGSTQKAGTAIVTATVTDAKGKKVKGTCRVFVGYNLFVVNAIPDDGKDDTAEFNSAINKASGVKNGLVWVPNGEYNVDVNAGKKIEMKSDLKLCMDNKAVIKALPSSKTDYCMVSFSGVKNVLFVGGKIIGEREKHSGKEGEGGHCIGIYNSSQAIQIDSVNISGAWGDGIHIANGRVVNSGIKIRKCSIHGNRMNNVDIESGDHITIEETNMWDHIVGRGLRIGSNDVKVPVSVVSVNKCQISSSNDTEAMAIPSPAYQVTFTGCTITGNAYNGACRELVFDACKITGELKDIEDPKYKYHKVATFKNMNKDTDIGKYIDKEEAKK